MTQPTDTELLKQLDQLLDTAIEIKLTRNFLSRPEGWCVVFKKQFESDDRHLWGSGGGRTAREALWCAIQDQAEKQKTMTVEAVIEKLS